MTTDSCSDLLFGGAIAYGQGASFTVAVACLGLVLAFMIVSFFLTAISTRMLRQDNYG